MNPEAAPLEISVTRRNVGTRDVCWIEASGELDLSNAEELERALRSPECAEADALVLGFDGIRFIDSTGIQLLLSAADTRSPAFAAVIAEGSPVRRLIEMVDAVDYVNAVADEREALGHLEGLDERD